jgi:hypothetical protein
VIPRILTMAAAVGTATSALALAVPITAHATVCANKNQSTGPGLGTSSHAFNSSKRNCADFEGSNDAAFFHSSNDNSVLFEAGANGNEVNLVNFNGGSIDFKSGSFGVDLETVSGTANITVLGSANTDWFDIIGTFTVPFSIASNNQGSDSNPILITPTSACVTGPHIC